MAWSAQVAAKSNVNGYLTVNVQYTDGTNVFNEVIDLTGGDVEGAKTRVRSRLAQLTSSDSLFSTIPIGFSNFSAATTTPTARDLFIAALRKFQSCQRAVTAGLITTSDTLYTTTQSDMLSKWDVSFIDSV